MSKLRVAIYTRVSTEEQANNFSLKAQEAVVREYAQRKDYDVVDVYCDDGYSGKDFNRPEVQRLLNDIKHDKVDAILVWKVDRLSRNNAEVLVLINNLLKPNNKKLIITSIDIDSSTTNGQMFISLLSTFAEYERATIIDRVNSGMQKRAEEGLWNGGQVFGYNNINKQLIVNDIESKIVEEIFLLRENGEGYKSIVNILNKRGEKTKKGKAFSIPGVKLILNNPVYIGMVKWGEHKDWNNQRRKGKAVPTYVDGVHSAIISKGIWDRVKKVNKVQAEAFSTNRNFKGDLFLTGILKCPKCGSGTVMSKSKKRNDEGYHVYYMCQGYHSKGKSFCSSNLIKQDIVEQKVLNVISELVRDDEIVNNIIEKLDAEKESNFEPMVKELEIYQSKLNSLMDKQTKLDKDYFDDKMEIKNYNRLSINIQSNIEAFQEKVKQQKREIEKLSSSNKIDNEIVIAALLNFNELFHKANGEEKKLLVRALIKEIQMDENRKDIKKIAFWFSSENALPSNKGSRTLS